MPAAIASSPISNGKSQSSPISSSKSNAGFTILPSTMRGTILLAAFVLTMIQIHLMFERTYQHASQSFISCQGDTTLKGNVTLVRPQDVTRLKDEWKIKPSALSGSAAATVQDDGTVGLNAPHSKHLPEINENGMIIFFLHIPKTGGTSMSHPFEYNPNWRYRMVYGWNKQAKFREEMYDTLRNWKPGMRIFYEYHGGRSSPYTDMQVREDVLTWRAMAQVRNIPFFAFTLVREPLSMAVSFFNFYYAHRKKNDERYFYVPDPTEQDFVELSLPSPQCLFCVHTEIAYYKGYRKAGNPVDVGREGCAAVYEAFVNDFDWIGTTEAMSQETFPLIGQIANVHFIKEITKNKSKDKIVRGSLTDAALAHIRNITVNDQMIYDNTKRDFPISMWKNFDPSLRLPQPEKFPTLNMDFYQEDHIAEIADSRYKRKGFKEKMQRLKAEHMAKQEQGRQQEPKQEESNSQQRQQEQNSNPEGNDESQPQNDKQQGQEKQQEANSNGEDRPQQQGQDSNAEEFQAQAEQLVADE